MKNILFVLVLILCLYFSAHSKTPASNILTPVNYAAGVVLSTLLGFGIGNYFVKQRNPMIVFAVLDTTTLISSITLLLFTFNPPGQQTGIIHGVLSRVGYLAGAITFSVIYLTSRIIELMFTIIGPITSIGRTKTAYINSKRNYFKKKIPIIYFDKNSLLLNYQYPL